MMCKHFQICKKLAFAVTEMNEQLKETQTAFNQILTSNLRTVCNNNYDFNKTQESFQLYSILANCHPEEIKYFILTSES